MDFSLGVDTWLNKTENVPAFMKFKIPGREEKH